jgi:formylglycine-generating enzyme required for sulfatase activity
MIVNRKKLLKPAGVAMLLAAASIIGLSCGGGSNPVDDDNPPYGSDAWNKKYGQWRIENWTPPDTSGYTTFNDNGIKVEMVRVEGGTFTMGCTMPEEGEMCLFDEGGYVTRRRCDGKMLQNLCATNEYPAHQVTVSSFYIAKYELTNQLWKDVMGGYLDSNYLEFMTFFGIDSSQYLKFPATCYGFNWDLIQNFITELNKRTGKTYRLLTEAEWEFAARGGNKSKNHVFAGSDAYWQVTYEQALQPVGKKLPNELGIYDMSGNIDETVSDWYADYTAEPQINPKGPIEGDAYIVRGGSDNPYGDGESSFRVSSRDRKSVV